jgi:hypothetical protein
VRRCAISASARSFFPAASRCCTAIYARSATSFVRNIRLTLLTTGLLLLKRANDVATLFDDVIVSIDGPRRYTMVSGACMERSM